MKKPPTYNKRYKVDHLKQKKEPYKDVEEGGVVVVVQDFLFQPILNAAVHLTNTNSSS